MIRGFSCVFLADDSTAIDKISASLRHLTDFFMDNSRTTLGFCGFNDDGEYGYLCGVNDASFRSLIDDMTLSALILEVLLISCLSILIGTFSLSWVWKLLSISNWCITTMEYNTTTHYSNSVTQLIQRS